MDATQPAAFAVLGFSWVASQPDPRYREVRAGAEAYAAQKVIGAIVVFHAVAPLVRFAIDGHGGKDLYEGCPEHLTAAETADGVSTTFFLQGREEGGWVDVAPLCSPAKVRAGSVRVATDGPSSMHVIEFIEISILFLRPTVLRKEQSPSSPAGRLTHGQKMCQKEARSASMGRAVLRFAQSERSLRSLRFEEMRGPRGPGGLRTRGLRPLALGSPPRS